MPIFKARKPLSNLEHLVMDVLWDRGSATSEDVRASLASRHFMFLISWGAFIGGGFQMVALKVGSYAFPREQAAMMSGIASGSFALLNAILSPRLGQLLDQQHYAAMFWTIALCPVVGVVVWWLLSRRQEVGVIK